MGFKENYALIDWSKRIEPKRRFNTEPARSSLPCPMIVSDAMQACEHVDGRFYDSKSAFRQVTKANGLIEVGNDAQRFKRPRKVNNDAAIERSIDKALSRI